MDSIDSEISPASKNLLTALKAALKAGEEILSIYNLSVDIDVQQKKDNTPITIADKRAHEVILRTLTEGSVGDAIPVLSEEGKEIPFDVRKDWDFFWMVDPLDGTKEFINRNGQFTVNIALIHSGVPVLGVVFVPVTSVLYFASREHGSWKIEIGKKGNNGVIVDEQRLQNYIDSKSFSEIINSSVKLPVMDKMNSHNKLPFTVIASRSHMNTETGEFIDSLKKKYEDVEIISAGSSLKFCLVAEGGADVYPRLGPTMEWDTAAAHAVVSGAGGRVVRYGSEDELVYNKDDLLNPWFVVYRGQVVHI